MWFSAIKLALNAGTHIYKKKQETKMLMADAQMNHAQNVDVQSIKSADQTWRDEWLCVVFSLIFIAHFIPVLQEAMFRGWEILELASDYFWIIILTIVGGSFGSSGITKFLKKKK